MKLSTSYNFNTDFASIEPVHSFRTDINMGCIMHYSTSVVLTNSQSPVYWDYIHGITWHEWRALTETSKICSAIWTKLFVQLFFMLSITHRGKIHSYRWPPCGSPNHFNHFPGPWLWESSCLLLVPADCYKNTFISAFPVLKPTFLLCLGIVG